MEGDANVEHNEGEAGGAGPADVDPKSIQAFITEVTLETVEAWSVRDVLDVFLTNIGMTDPGVREVFAKHRVTGPVLLHMSREDIDELGTSINGMDPLPAPTHESGRNLLTVGDRVYMWDLLQILQHKKKRVDRSKELWSVKTPTGGLQYYASCFECLKYKLCPCAMPFDHYTVTLGEVRVDFRPPRTCMQCCIPTEVMIKDLRFLKDVDTVKQCGNAPFCCWKKKGMTLAFHQEHGVDHHPEDVDKDLEVDVHHQRLVIWHPSMTHERAEEILAVWAEVRLVGD
eukprot:m.8180 g.8180  ORF g.8180 m.8180 type:complete len:285 (+) comp2510_c0_seq1:160-1014(+)